MIKVTRVQVAPNVVELVATGPANEKNRGAHAADREARTLSREVRFSIHKLRQGWSFKDGRYTFTDRYSTAL